MLGPLHKLLQDILTRELQNIIHSDARSIVSVADGNVRLENVRLRCDVLEQMLSQQLGVRLPVRIALAHCTLLSVSIPWGDWRRGYTEVTIDGLTVLLVSRTRLPDPDEVRANKEALVRHLMERILHEHHEQHKAPSATGGLVHTLLRNLLAHCRPRVHLSRVHVRYEHTQPLACGAPSAAVGLTLRAADLVHADEGFGPLVSEVCGVRRSSRAALPSSPPVVVLPSPPHHRLCDDVWQVALQLTDLAAYVDLHAEQQTLLSRALTVPSSVTDSGATTDSGDGRSSADVALPPASGGSGAPAEAAAAEARHCVRRMQAMAFDDAALAGSGLGAAAARGLLIGPLALSATGHLNLGPFFGTAGAFELPLLSARLSLEPTARLCCDARQVCILRHLPPSPIFSCLLSRPLPCVIATRRRLPRCSRWAAGSARTRYESCTLSTARTCLEEPNPGALLPTCARAAAERDTAFASPWRQAARALLDRWQGRRPRRRFLVVRERRRAPSRARLP